MKMYIRTERMQISSRLRQKVIAFVHRTCQREWNRIDSIVVNISPAKQGVEQVGFVCRIRVWSHFLGQIAVTDVGDTLRTAIQQAVLRTRGVIRRRVHKRRSEIRRNGRARLSSVLSKRFLEQAHFVRGRT